MKTFKIVYTIDNKPGRFVTFLEAAGAEIARCHLYEQYGGLLSNNIVICEITEVRL